MDHNTRTPDVVGIVQRYGICGVLSELHDHAESMSGEASDDPWAGLRAILEAASMYAENHGLDLYEGAP